MDRRGRGKASEANCEGFEFVTSGGKPGKERPSLLMKTHCPVQTVRRLKPKEGIQRLKYRMGQKRKRKIHTQVHTTRKKSTVPYV